jgi:hypothetical protein
MTYDDWLEQPYTELAEQSVKIEKAEEQAEKVANDLRVSFEQEIDAAVEAAIKRHDYSEILTDAYHDFLADVEERVKEAETERILEGESQ